MRRANRRDLVCLKSIPGAPAVGEPDGMMEAVHILNRVRGIPEGFVQTYGDINPHNPRLVGRVLASTSEDVPWHRVVRADGSIPLGRAQRDRLQRERVPMRGDRVDMRLARWPGAMT
jgi:methylated-DNA-protein-cysteine methyltransferase related protein